MSNIRGEEIFNATGFGWFVRLPVALFRLVYGNITSTLSSNNKKFLKEIEKTAISKAEATASRRLYYKDTDENGRLVVSKKGGEDNLGIYVKALSEAMINIGFSYDYQGLNDYKSKLNKLNKVLKCKSKLHDKIDGMIFNSTFSRKKTLSTLTGCCQDLSTVFGIALASQKEKTGRLSCSTKYQNLLDEDEVNFIKSFPDRKVSLVFGNYVEVNKPHKESEHVIICIEYKDNNGKEKAKYVDPTIFLDSIEYPRSVDRHRASIRYTWIDINKYQDNLRCDKGVEFEPKVKLELKENAGIEQIYRDLYDTTHLYDDAKGYDYVKLEK